LGVRGPKSKIEERRFVEYHMDGVLKAKKMARFRRETIQKGRIDLKEGDIHTHGQTDRVNDKNNRLLA